MNGYAKQDKASTFEVMMIPHLDAAYTLARWLTRSPEDADEAVQEAYLRAFRYFDGFTGTDGRAWLLAILRNSCLDLFRRRRRTEAVSFDEQIHSASTAALSPEKTMQKDATMSVLKDCIEALPVEYRETLVLRELQELPTKRFQSSSPSRLAP